MIYKQRKSFLFLLGYVYTGKRKWCRVSEDTSNLVNLDILGSNPSPFPVSLYSPI
jgi:hypothetical protein